MTRIYLAGPMTGRADWNHPAFHAAAAQLRALGSEVVNPAELHDPHRGGTIHSWEWYMRQALTAMLNCDEVALLDAWETSRGARLEKLVADELGMPTHPLGRGVKISARARPGQPAAVIGLPPRRNDQTFSDRSA